MKFFVLMALVLLSLKSFSYEQRLQYENGTVCAGTSSLLLFVAGLRLENDGFTVTKRPVMDSFLKGVCTSYQGEMVCNSKDNVKSCINPTNNYFTTKQKAEFNDKMLLTVMNESGDVVQTTTLGCYSFESYSLSICQ